MTAAPRPAPPRRPPRAQEALAQRLFLALAPRLPRPPAPAPPARLAPFELLSLPSRRPGVRIGATRFACPGGGRGTVLLLPPWVTAGRAYFHQRGRVQGLRGAGYEVVTIDLPPAGRRGGRFFDRDVEDAVRALAARGRRTLHLWGVSSGGYWAHPVLARGGAVAGAFFEDVSPHLLEWSARAIPWGRPCYAFFRRALPVAYRFLDMRSHAAAFRLAAAAYVGGGEDPAVLPADTRALARAAGAASRVVPGAGHLGSIKRARREVIDLALATFERAGERRAAAPYPSTARASPSSRRSTSSGVL